MLPRLLTTQKYIFLEGLLDGENHPKKHEDSWTLSEEVTVVDIVFLGKEKYH